MSAAMTNGHHNGVVNGSGDESGGWSMSKPLQELDSEVYSIIQKEKRRQTASLEMIARYAQSPHLVIALSGRPKGSYHPKPLTASKTFRELQNEVLHMWA